MKTELLEHKENTSTLKHKLLSVEKDLDIMQKNHEEKNLRAKDDHDRKMADVLKNMFV